MAIETIGEVENLDSKLESIDAGRINEGVSTLVGIYSVRLDSTDSVAITTPYVGEIIFCGISGSRQGFDMLLAEGYLDDRFGKARIDGMTDSWILEFKKIYIRGNVSFDLSYRFERRSSSLWVGTYTLRTEDEEIIGDTECLITPHYNTVQVNKLTHS